MRVKVELRAKKDIVMDKSYNHLVQAFIYSNLDGDIAHFIHNDGYTTGNRVYKLFTFSKIRSVRKPFIKGDRINLGRDIHFYISSISDNFINSFCKNIFNNRLLIGDNELRLNSLDIEDRDYLERFRGAGRLEIKLLSPVVIYSTDESGEKRWYNPFDDDFSKRVLSNLVNKYTAFHGVAPDVSDFSLEVSNKNIKQYYDRFKNSFIKGYVCRFYLDCSFELLNIAYNCGIGSKNSQGFGFIDIC